jgi:cytochrome c oxidase cbb3-type subunit 4
MSLDDLRIGVTIASFIAFLGIAAWAWAGRNRAGFDEAAQLPFADDRPGEPS